MEKLWIYTQNTPHLLDNGCVTVADFVSIPDSLGLTPGAAGEVNRRKGKDVLKDHVY